MEKSQTLRFYYRFASGRLGLEEWTQWPDHELLVGAMSELLHEAEALEVPATVLAERCAAVSRRLESEPGRDVAKLEFKKGSSHVNNADIVPFRNFVFCRAGSARATGNGVARDLGPERARLVYLACLELCRRDPLSIADTRAVLGAGGLEHYDRSLGSGVGVSELQRDLIRRANQQRASLLDRIESGLPPYPKDLESVAPDKWKEHLAVCGLALCEELSLAVGRGLEAYLALQANGAPRPMSDAEFDQLLDDIMGRLRFDLGHVGAPPPKDGGVFEKMAGSAELLKSKSLHAQMNRVLISAIDKILGME